MRKDSYQLQHVLISVQVWRDAGNSQHEQAY